MTTPFYESFGAASYPVYWLADDGTFWMNNAAHQAAPPHGDGQLVRRILEPYLRGELETNQPAFTVSMLTGALHTQKLGLMPMPGGLLAAGMHDNELPMAAFSTQLREMLSNIFALLPMVGRHLADDGRLQYVTEIQQNCYDMLRLTSNLEYAAKLETKEYRAQPIDLAALVESLGVSAASVCQNSFITMHTKLPGQPVLVSADLHMLSSAILSVVRNSLQYTRDGNEVTLRLYQAGQRAVLRIEDKGLGIQPKHLAHIFDPYFSADPYGDGAPKPGLGLGLSVARTAIRAFGGTIAAESRFGEGTTITIALPLAQVPEGGEVLRSMPADYLRNRYSPVYVQLTGFCQLPEL